MVTHALSPTQSIELEAAVFKAELPISRSGDQPMPFLVQLSIQQGCHHAAALLKCQPASLVQIAWDSQEQRQQHAPGRSQCLCALQALGPFLFRQPTLQPLEVIESMQQMQQSLHLLAIQVHEMELIKEVLRLAQGPRQILQVQLHRFWRLSAQGVDQEQDLLPPERPLGR